LQSLEFSPFTKRMCEESWRASTGLAATRSWRSRRVSLPETPSSRTDTRPRRAARRIVSLSRPTHQASIPCQPTSQAHPACGFSPLSSASAAPWAPRHRPSSGRSLPGWRGRCLTGCSTRRAGPRRAVLPTSALRSPSLLAGRLLLASVGAPALPRRPTSPTDWLGPDPARCFDCPVDPAPAEQ
jgi:hypothetical protein